MTQPLLQVENLRTYFLSRWGTVKAVDGVSFSVHPGETLGLVGESGCGKSVTCLSILRLVPQPAGKIVGGRVLWEGEDLLKKSEVEMRRIRGGCISMILQDPMTSLNPVFSIGDQVAEGIAIHRRLKGKTLWQKTAEVLGLVRISSAKARLRDYPHQFSGGMRQRVVGAISLACEPRLLIADEPTTSLDVTIQLQYLNLLKEIQRRSGVAMIFVTHDFGIVAKTCDRVAVMYAGRIVEIASVRDLFSRPAHPYTRALLDSIPNLEEQVDRLYSIEGQPPALHSLPPGCAFAPRCPYATRRCDHEYPPEVSLNSGHMALCWRVA
ncbi:MAG: ABC transporter ATP-binding protein [Deltaproteobacteria bacterium]|nr:ABC transporter ATP-binding protein [Deltaproteobacteria bacterium]